MSQKRKIEECNNNESIYLRPTRDLKLLKKADRSRLIEGEGCDWCGFPFSCMTPPGREPFHIYSANTGKRGRNNFCCLPCAYKFSDSNGGGNSLGRRYYTSEQYPDAQVISSAPHYSLLKRCAGKEGCLALLTYEKFFDLIEKKEMKAKLEVEKESVEEAVQAVQAKQSVVDESPTSTTISN